MVCLSNKNAVCRLIDSRNDDVCTYIVCKGAVRILVGQNTVHTLSELYKYMYALGQNIFNIKVLENNPVGVSN